MAGMFPQASDVFQLMENVRLKKDSIRSLSQERIHDTALPENIDSRPMGFLDGIDKFDHNFFNLSYSEAKNMDPVQRLLLQTVYHTIENAGYPHEKLMNKNISVYAADALLEYYKFAEKFDETLVTGNTKAFLASRINNFFSWRGGAFNVDTTCSSSLAIVQLACNELVLKQSEYALICAGFTNLFPDWKEYGLDLEDPSGKSKAFSDQANGMSMGECIAAVLLKPLSEALNDRDHIHAVIKGWAVGNNTNSAASLTAPDSRAQAYVIQEAWRRAGINMEEIGFFEAHGSGTKLGDHIEISGINQAFKDVPLPHKFPISTIKNNIGHCRAAAGIASLIKTTSSLKQRSLFPTIHFDTPSSLIDFNSAVTFVQTDFEPWVSAEGKKRYAGISSIGLSGTNCHVVLEEAPERSVPVRDTVGKQLCVVSGKTITSLYENVRALKIHLTNHALSLQDVCFTLATGRSHFNNRCTFIAENILELLQQINDVEFEKIPPAQKNAKTIFVFADFQSSLMDCEYFSSHYPLFKEIYTELDNSLPSQEITKERISFAFQYTFFRFLERMGITTDDLLGIGIGEFIVDYIAGDASMETTLNKIDQYQSSSQSSLSTRLEKMLRRENEKGPVVFIWMGAKGTTEQSFLLYASGYSQVEVCVPRDADSVLQIAGAMYKHNASIDWEKFYSERWGQRVELPGYRFDTKRCWLRSQPIKKEEWYGNLSEKHTAKIILTEEGDSVSMLIAKVWADLLDTAPYSLTDNFFEKGGDSLNATKLINQLNLKLNLHLSFEDVFDFPTIHELTRHIAEALTTERLISVFWEEALGMEAIGVDENFFDLGGHSLLANQIINRVQRQFGITLSFDKFFQYPTIGLLAKVIDSEVFNHAAVNNSNKEAEMSAIALSEDYELSHAQLRLWFISNTEGGSVGYNIPVKINWNNTLQIEVLKITLEKMVQRHESLRTVFVAKDNGEVRQKILLHTDLDFKIIDLNNGDSVAERVEELYQTELVESFDLMRGPLFRFRIICHPDKSYTILFTMHHIISDAWSSVVMLREMKVIYQALLSGETFVLPHLPIQYKDYTAWHHRSLSDGNRIKHKSYWLKIFEQRPLRISLPYDKKRPPKQTFSGAYIQFLLDADQVSFIDTLTKSTTCTSFVTYFSLLVIFLYKYTNDEDIILGTPVSGRSHHALENQIGFYVNMIPIRSRISPRQTILEFLKTSRMIITEALSHAAYPFDLVVNDLKLERDLSRNPLFDVAVTVDQFENVLNIEAEVTSGKRPCHLDLRFMFVPTGSKILVEILYNTDIFQEDTIYLMKERFVAFINFLMKNPDYQIDKINIASAWETQNASPTIDIQFNF
jgi:3-oxoacyl-(acyl-carrier-protein) synthase/acyl carrier protein